MQQAQALAASTSRMRMLLVSSAAGVVVLSLQFVHVADFSLLDCEASELVASMPLLNRFGGSW